MRDYGRDRHPSDPYQCFMGRWEGLCKTFDNRGNYIESCAVHMDVHWVAPDVWHLHEDFEHLFEVGPQVYHSDFKVEGKFCHARNEIITVEGIGMTAYNYNFIIDSKVTNSLVYNNHYFLDPDTRRIITHKLRGGKTHCMQIQDFVRVERP
jgi:hypothetical protein